VLIVHCVGGVELRSIEIAFAGHIRRHVVEDEVAKNIGHEMDVGVSLEDGELRVDIIDFRLQRRDIEEYLSYSFSFNAEDG